MSYLLPAGILRPAMNVHLGTVSVHLHYSVFCVNSDQTFLQYTSIAACVENQMVDIGKDNLIC